MDMTASARQVYQGRQAQMGLGSLLESTAWRCIVKIFNMKLQEEQHHLGENHSAQN